MKTANYYIKTNRIFTPLRKWSWVFILIVAIAGLWYPKLGLLMIPVMIALPISGLFKGKFWCGNICPHGSLFDRFILPISANRKIPAWAKSKITMTLAFIWFMFMLGKRLIKVSALWGTLPFLEKLGFIFVMNYFVVTVIGTTLALFVSTRTWCNFCPMSTFQLLSYKLGKKLGLNKKTDKKVSIARKEMCHNCGKCSRVCPMQLQPYLEFSGKNQLDNDRCIRCATCVNNCPAGILSLDNEENALKIAEKTPLNGYEDIQKIKSKIKTIKDLGNNVREFTTVLEEPPKIKYTPGQFILVKIQEEPQMYRAFSVSGYFPEKSELRFTVKKAPLGYGTDIIFNNFKEGQPLELKGPMGNELIVDKDAKRVVFVAGGIGITPFLPLVEDMLKGSNQAQEIILVYGVNKQGEFLYDDYFEGQATKNSRFHYKKVVAFDENWKGKKGFVTDALKELDLKDAKIYMCGPKPMIKPTLNLLHELGVKNEDIRYESA